MTGKQNARSTGTASTVSFGMVAMYEFDTSAANHQTADAALPAKLPKRLSVEDFERFHRRLPRRNKPKTVTCASSSKQSVSQATLACTNKKVNDEGNHVQDHRSQRLERLRHQIHHTLNSTDEIVLGCRLDDFSSSGSRWMASSFPGPQVPNKPQRSANNKRSEPRMSQLHLSRLDLVGASSITTSSAQPQGSMQNATFSFQEDAAPKRPTRKRSSECLVDQEARMLESNKCKINQNKLAMGDVVPPSKKAITLCNAAYWESLPPTKKRTTGMHNATWPQHPQPTRKSSRNKAA